MKCALRLTSDDPVKVRGAYLLMKDHDELEVRFRSAVRDTGVPRPPVSRDYFLIRLD